MTWLGFLTTLVLFVAACGGGDSLGGEGDFESPGETTADSDRARTLGSSIAELARQTCDDLLGVFHADTFTGFYVLDEKLISRAVQAAEEIGFTGEELALSMGVECPRTMEACDNCEAMFEDIRPETAP